MTLEKNVVFLFYPVPCMTIFESPCNQSLHSFRALITLDQINSHCCYIPMVFSRVHATLQPALSIGWSVGRLVGHALYISKDFDFKWCCHFVFSH